MYRICKYCGDGFETTKKNKVYCCIECRETAKQKRRDIRNGRKNKSRKSGDFGVYLCHKWRLEGMQVRTIAQIKNITVDQVKDALAIPLTKEQKATLRTYFDPRPGYRLPEGF